MVKRAFTKVKQKFKLVFVHIELSNVIAIIVI